MTKDTPATAAFIAHCNVCPLLCGIDYTRGRCAEGDRLGDAMEAEAKKPWCCFIPDEEQGKPKPVGCQKAPEWNVHAEGDPPDVVTQACTDHVGHLLSDKGWHRVWPLEITAS